MKFNLLKRIFSLSSRPIDYIVQFGDFGVALIEYFAHKIDQFISYIQITTVKNAEFVLDVKFKTAARLIWSQGRFGKRLRYAFVLLFALSIYLTGGLFQQSFVNEKKLQGGPFLSQSGSIIFEKATAATYSAEISLLDEPIEHEVQAGDTLASIGQKYGISEGSIKYANDLVSNYVRVGQVLKIPPFEGTLHEVKKGDTIEKLSKLYNVPTQTIVDTNYMDAPYELVVGTTIIIPDAQLPSEQKFYAGTNVYETSAYGILPEVGEVSQGSGSFIWPASGQITQGFYPGHPAIDIANSGVNIISTDTGTVVRAGWWQGGYGNAVQIDHGNGYVTTYAHLSSIEVSNGQDVEKGQKLGVIGSTGRSTGPHLHFTIQLNGKYLNPLLLLPN